MEECRTIPAALHVIFSCPHDFDWNSGGLCHMNGFDHEVGLRCSTPAKSATQKGSVDLNFFIRKSDNPGCGRAVDCLKLGSGPDLAGVGSKIHSAVQRLHHQMREVR